LDELQPHLSASKSAPQTSSFRLPRYLSKPAPTFSRTQSFSAALSLTALLVFATPCVAKGTTTLSPLSTFKTNCAVSSSSFKETLAFILFVFAC